MFHTILQFIKKHQSVFVITGIIIITFPAFRALFENGFFSIHDDQHISRLYLLDQAIRQGDLYPRWVDILGFGYGYPLFNFYPPLIYYLSELFVLIGFSYITSIKLMILTGFVLGAYGMYLYAKKFLNIIFSFTVAILFTYFTYKATTVFIRGALAEFFALSIFPFVLLGLHNLYKSPSIKNSMLFGISYAFLILTHPFIAFPGILYTFFVFTFYLYHTSKKHLYTLHTFIGGVIALGLSSFFWIPSLIEKKFTLVDNILLTELAQYNIHFIYPFQFWYSAWGYGGSIEGPYDGISFQLGKLYIGLAAIAIILFIVYLLKRKGIVIRKKLDSYFIFFALMTFFSLFITTGYSMFLWEKITFLQYLQFPWRFLSFANIFIPISCVFALYYFFEIFASFFSKKAKSVSMIIASCAVIIATIYLQYDLFIPQNNKKVSDKDVTTYSEIAWRVSRTSFEFIPKGVRMTKSDLNTSIPAVTEKDIKSADFILSDSHASVEKNIDTFRKKQFTVQSENPFIFTLQTFNFPGWTAFLDNKEIPIRDDNGYKLITVDVPQGSHTLLFIFKNTPVRTIANTISLIFFIALIGYGLYLVREKK